MLRRLGPDTPVDAAGPGARKPMRTRTLAAALIAVGVAATAVVFFWWGAASRSQNTAIPQPTPSPSASGPLTVAEIYTTLLPSIVSIKATTTHGTSGGTGLVVNADGSILTALHVVRGATAIEVAFADGTRVPATITASQPATDIATLTPTGPPGLIVPAVLGGSARLAVGDQVVAIGDQLALRATTTSGIVSGLDRSVTVNDVGGLTGLIQFDAAVNPGSSGGPLVNAEGQTVGIVVALANPSDADTFIGVGFAVPITTALRAGRPPQL